MEKDKLFFIDSLNNIIKQKFDMCDGCSTFINSDSLTIPFCACSLPPIFNKELSCPCVECLIKMVCTTECDKIEEYAKNLTETHKKIMGRLIDDILERRYKKENE